MNKKVKMPHISGIFMNSLFLGCKELVSMALIRTELNSPTSRSEERLTEIRQGHMALGLGWEPGSFRHGA